jgi:hypothetical protein
MRFTLGREVAPNFLLRMPNLIDTRIRLFSSHDGGRQVSVDAAASLYAPHLRVDSNGEYLGVRMVDGPAELRPGDSAEVAWELMYDGVDYSPLSEGARFMLMEGPRVIGEGEVVRRHEEAVTYEFVHGSDVERGGMFLELDRITRGQRQTVCEIFHSDVDVRLTFTVYARTLLPLEQVEELIRRARALLPPRQ